MCKKCSNKPKKSNKNLVQNDGLTLDTLAQMSEPVIQEVTRKKMQKKARAKFMTQGLCLGLVDLRSPLKQSYWNSYHCNSFLEQKGKKLTSKYCNNRWCIVCNRIRVAKLIKGYYPVLQEMNEKYFITLTVPNVNAEDLQDTIEKMNQNIRYIFNEYFRRTLKKKVLGLKKIEVTYNPQRKYQPYHPHFHLILDNEVSGVQLIEKWLQLNPMANSIAQDIRPADDNSIMELFKYFAKTAVKMPDGKIDINTVALDVIYTAMRGKRVYQPYGIEKVSEDIDDIHSTDVQDLAENDTVWFWLENDWIDRNSGEVLTGYEPNKEFKKLVKSIANK